MAKYQVWLNDAGYEPHSMSGLGMTGMTSTRRPATVVTVSAESCYVEQTGQLVLSDGSRQVAGFAIGQWVRWERMDG